MKNFFFLLASAALFLFSCNIETDEFSEPEAATSQADYIADLSSEAYYDHESESWLVPAPDPYRMENMIRALGNLSSNSLGINEYPTDLFAPTHFHIKNWLRA